MKFLEIVQESLLGLSIAIMLPAVTYWGVNAATTYWGVNSFYSASQVYEREKTEQTTAETQAIAAEQTRTPERYWNNYQRINFWAHLVVALIAISIGAFLRIYSLSVGFIGGGVLNLFLSIVRNPYTPAVNFGIFLSLLIFLIFITTYRKRVQCTVDNCA